MNFIDERCASSSVRLIHPILLLIRSVTERQRKYIWLINLIDDDAYFRVGQVYMMYLTWQKIFIPLKKQILESTENINFNTYVLRYIIQHKITNISTFSFMFPCHVKKSIWNARDIHLQKNVLLIRHRQSIVFRASPH